MGGRGSWSAILNSTSTWAGMAAVAGELDATQLHATARLQDVIRSGLPIRHHHGSSDESSKQEQFDATTTAFENAAAAIGLKSQLISTVVNGADHTAMQYDRAWDATLLRWLLDQSASAHLHL